MSKTIFWASALCTVAAFPALGDQWNKTFSVGAAPELRIETSDANVTLRASNVKTIEARVYTSGWKIGPLDVRVTDHQTGDLVEIEVKIPPVHFNLGNRWVKIEVQVPSATKADVHTGDGNIRADDLRGQTRLVTHDGGAGIAHGRWLDRTYRRWRGYAAAAGRLRREPGRAHRRRADHGGSAAHDGRGHPRGLG